MPEIEPLTGSEIQQIRNALARSVWIRRAMFTAIGAGIGGALFAAFMSGGF